jgi:hypothetical protein
LKGETHLQRFLAVTSLLLKQNTTWPAWLSSKFAIGPRRQDSFKNPVNP